MYWYGRVSMRALNHAREDRRNCYRCQHRLGNYDSAGDIASDLHVDVMILNLSFGLLQGHGH